MKAKDLSLCPRGRSSGRYLSLRDDEAQLARVKISAHLHVWYEEAEVINLRLLEGLYLDDSLMHQRNASAKRVFDEDGKADGLFAFLLFAELDAARSLAQVEEID